MVSKHWDEDAVINNILHLHSAGEDLSCSHIQKEHRDLYLGAVRVFGSWNDAITAAGFDYDKIRKRKEWSRSKIIATIKRLHREGEDLSCARMQRDHGDLAAAAAKRFGNWGNAVKASGIDYDAIRRYQHWSKKRIVEEIRKAYEAGEDLNWHSCITGKRRKLLYAAVRESRFGSWEKALEAAGIDYKDVRRYRSWDKDKVVNRIRELHEQGVSLNAKHIQTHYGPIYDAAVRRFNSWEDAIESAGFNYSDIAIRRKRSREEILEELREILGNGEPLSDTHVRRKYPALHAAACREFGCWTAARKEIGLHKNYRRKWDRKTIVEEIRRLYKKGVPLTKKHLRENNRLSMYAASMDDATFGSWVKARQEALAPILASESGEK
jgi:hypothetical protein